MGSCRIQLVLMPVKTEQTSTDWGAEVFMTQDQDMYDKLDEPDDDENDMLDLAFGLTETCVKST